MQALFWPSVMLLLFALPPARHFMEASMAMHMLFQLPLLAFLGAWMGSAICPPKIVFQAEPTGLALLLVAVFAGLWWMIPRNLDAALQGGIFESAKFITVPVLVGMPLAWCWKRLSPLVRAIAWTQLIAMMMVMGWLLLSSPARLCASYLLDQQVIAGRGFLALGIIVALFTAAHAFRGTGNHCAITASIDQPDA
jgi:hypothetical protein